MEVNDYFSDECGCELRAWDCKRIDGITIDGSILESLVKAYNFALKYTQDHPKLEVYYRDGKLFACDWDLPHEPEFEFELYEKLIAHEIG